MMRSSRLYRISSEYSMAEARCHMRARCDPIIQLGLGWLVLNRELSAFHRCYIRKVSRSEDLLSGSAKIVLNSVRSLTWTSGLRRAISRHIGLTRSLELRAMGQASGPMHGVGLTVSQKRVERARN